MKKSILRIIIGIIIIFLGINLFYTYKNVSSLRKYISINDTLKNERDPSKNVYIQGNTLSYEEIQNINKEYPHMELLVLESRYSIDSPNQIFGTLTTLGEVSIMEVPIANIKSTFGEREYPVSEVFDGEYKIKEDEDGYIRVDHGTEHIKDGTFLRKYNPNKNQNCNAPTYALLACPIFDIISNIQPKYFGFNIFISPKDINKDFSINIKIIGEQNKKNTP